ncbi:hypothetical protein [Mucilaginibacter dorajii]|uniref:Uncharacterized protein n=1 Tax=Mucilaginibacter dorajii TaxID=692994 RepID=A0ABP7Q106_9SPHI|nr:hypothetical protein [Mucilaginibacter dorajii]MCS3732888.1 hypothetical protein [Mucilaginibacter dorajii]
MNANKNNLLVNKSSQQKCFFALKASALQNGQNLGWNYFALTLITPAAKNFLCSATAQPRIVLPVFARSRSADTFGKTKTSSIGI